MTSGVTREGGDNYETTLRKLMHDCLPPILVELVDKRPPDPIEYMAHCLYRYQENTDQNTFAHVHVSNCDDVRHKTDTSFCSTTNNNNDSTGISASINRHAAILSMVHIDERDFLNDMSEDLNTFKITGNMVHELAIRVLDEIGDIFNDDDLV